MQITDILEEVKILSERDEKEADNKALKGKFKIPKGTKAFKIVHHDDADGVGSATMVRKKIVDVIFKNEKLQNELFPKIKEKMDKKAIRAAVAPLISTTTISDSTKPDRALKAITKSPNQMLTVVDFDRFSKFGDEVMKKLKTDAIDFHSDHHDTDPDQPKLGKEGRIGATEFKSDTEHIATDFMDKKDLNLDIVNMFSKWDSATFDQDLKKELGIEKGDPKYDDIKKLGAILSSMSRGNDDNDAMKLFIKHAPAEATDTAKDMLDYAERLKEIMNLKAAGVAAYKKKDGPDMKQIDEIRGKIKKLAKGMGANWKKDFLFDKKTKAKFVSSNLDSMGKSARESLKKADKDFDTSNPYTIVPSGGTSARGNRYLPFVIKNPNLPEGIFFTGIRQWAGLGMIQPSMSPDAPKELKDKIDIGAMTPKVIAAMEKKYGTKYNKWAFDIMKQESGGHKAITNLTGVGLLALLPKAQREEFKELKPVIDRIKNLKNLSGKKVRETWLAKPENKHLKAKWERFEELVGMKKKQSEIKAGIMKFAQQEYVKLIDAEMKKYHIPKKIVPPTAKEEITNNAGVKKDEKKDDFGMKPTEQDLKDAAVAEAQYKKLMSQGKVSLAQESKKLATELKNGTRAKRREENKKKVAK